jgi:glycosyltransferase involved in cell wall biosynthesis
MSTPATIRETMGEATGRCTRPLVLHVRCVTSAGGGPDKTILHSPRYYEQLGYRAILVYLHPPGDPGIEDLKRRALALDAPLIPVTDRGPLDLRSLGELIRICRRERVDVWHGHDPKTDVLGLAVRRFWPLRMITTIHGWIANTSREKWYKRLDQWSLRGYECVVCVSQALHAQCLAAGVHPDRCLLIENGIDTVACQRRMTTQEAKRRLGLSDSACLIGSVGRLSDEKGFDLLIDAVARLSARRRDIRLWIAGEGPARPRLEDQIAALGCRDRIRLLGHMSDPGDLYQALDVFVLSSRSEGLPNTVLEAMVYQTPVVATCVGGVATLVEDGRTGVLVAPGDGEALTAGIERLADDARLRRECVRNAHRLIESSFGLEGRMRKMCATYDRLLLPQSQRAPPALRAT